MDANAQWPPPSVVMERVIVGFHQDEHGDWVADLVCGHGQHVRHQPPFMNRPWVLTEEGRQRRLGQTLVCKTCNEERTNEVTVIR
ncbi:MAG TPA: DUF3565 domain-containing protein [Nitrospiraceae bacterium]|nr:DUF3565 domain-containing protein [Nitrospiraceae bacterium]